MIWVWFCFEGEHDGWALISLILVWTNRFEISLGLALMVWFRRCLGDLLAGFLGFWVEGACFVCCLGKFGQGWLLVLSGSLLVSGCGVW